MTDYLRFRKLARLFAAALLLSGAVFPALADDVIPASPKQHFNDYANVVSEETVKKLDAKLAQFEKDTTAQVVVVVYSKMQSDASVDDYTLRVAKAWKFGQAGKNNGIVLFVFVKDHTMRIQIGLGFEKIVTDDICRRILSEEIIPSFKKGNFDEGLTKGVDAIIEAAQGKYAPSDAKPSATPTPK